MDSLPSYIPSRSVTHVLQLIKDEDLEIKVKNERKTRHGDYRRLANGKHQITVNSNLNPYKFLITLIHEIAHLRAYKEYGNQIRPHGREWKQTFQKLMLPLIHPDIFPEDLLAKVAKHFINPKASSDTDGQLALALRNYNAQTDKIMVVQIPEGRKFKMYNGRIFERGLQNRKRIQCKEIKSGKWYLFNPNAEVDIIE